MSVVCVLYYCDVTLILLKCHHSSLSLINQMVRWTYVCRIWRKNMQKYCAIFGRWCRKSVSLPNRWASLKRKSASIFTSPSRHHQSRVHVICWSVVTLFFSQSNYRIVRLSLIFSAVLTYFSSTKTTAEKVSMLPTSRTAAVVGGSLVIAKLSSFSTLVSDDVTSRVTFNL